MIVKTGQAVVTEFATAHPATGAATDADALPTGTLTVNGVDDAAVVTVANVTTGRYKASVTLPTLAAGDCVAIIIAATVDGIAGTDKVWEAIADTARISEVNAAVVDVDTEIAALVTAVITNAAGVDIAADIIALKAVADAVKLITDTLTAASITVTSPVAESGTITIYTGDDYSSDEARQISLAVVDATHLLLLDAVGCTNRLKLGQATWEGTATETVAGYTVVWEPTAAQTAAITRSQTYEFEATLANGHVCTLARGQATRVADIPVVT